VTEDRRTADERPSRSARLAWGAVIVILLGVVTLVTYALTHASSPTAPATPAVTSPAVLAALSSVPASVFDAVGVTAAGTTLTAPSLVNGPASFTVGGKPDVLFVGAEFCPFCAAERWPLVVALARFGRFTELHDSASAPLTVFPNTSTFTFDGVGYSSRYVTLTGVELYSGTTGPDGTFNRLARLSPGQAALVAHYAPQNGGVVAGTAPFVDVAGRLVAVTSGFSPALLVGLSQAQIAGEVANPTPPVKGSASGSGGTSVPPTGQAVIAVANQLAAGICAATGQQPPAVCHAKGVRTADAALGLPVPMPPSVTTAG
jgi:hypothetical protein